VAPKLVTTTKSAALFLRLEKALEKLENFFSFSMPGTSMYTTKGSFGKEE